LGLIQTDVVAFALCRRHANGATVSAGRDPYMTRFLLALMVFALPVLAEPKVVLDEEVAVGQAKGVLLKFKVEPGLLPGGRNVTVTVEGKKHTDKGFAVMVAAPANVAADDWNAGKAMKVTHLEGFWVEDVKKWTHTGKVAPGEYVVGLRNEKNLLFGMTAAVRVTVD